MRVGVREVLPSPVTKFALEAAVVRAESKLGLRAVQRSARIVPSYPAREGPAPPSSLPTLDISWPEKQKSIADRSQPAIRRGGADGA